MHFGFFFDHHPGEGLLFSPENKGTSLVQFRLRKLNNHLKANCNHEYLRSPSASFAFQVSKILCINSILHLDAISCHFLAVSEWVGKVLEN